MADEDDFDIDIYGDDRPDFVQEPADEPTLEQAPVAGDKHPDDLPIEPETEPRLDAALPPEPPDIAQQQQVTAGDIGLANQDTDRKIEIATQGKVDPDATTSLRLNEVQWWTTEDKIRGWANQAGAEDDLKEITFNEHKVNGKSKGEVFLLFESSQAASALKQHIEAVVKQQPEHKKITIWYSTTETNPFKSFSKDAASRNRVVAKEQTQYNNDRGGYRGGRGFYRGGYHNQNRGGYNDNNNNFGMNNMGMGMNSFGGNMGFSGYGGFGNMGGMMGMMPNMAMGMGGMDMSSMGFQQGQFNQQQQFPFNNPHGAKRPRPE